MRRKQYSWSGHRRDQQQVSFLMLVLVVLIGIITLLAHWLNF